MMMVTLTSSVTIPENEGYRKEAHYYHSHSAYVLIAYLIFSSYLIELTHLICKPLSPCLDSFACLA